MRNLVSSDQRQVLVLESFGEDRRRVHPAEPRRCDVAVDAWAGREDQPERQHSPSFLQDLRLFGLPGLQDGAPPLVVTENGSIYKQVGARDRFTLQRDKISENLSTTIRETYGNTREEEIALIARKIAASQHTYLVGLAPSAGVAKIVPEHSQRRARENSC